MMEQADVVDVLPENWQAFEVFMACQTQWQYAGLGQAVGIQYAALESVMRMMAIEDMPETFQKVRLIEQGALQQISENK